MFTNSHKFMHCCNSWSQQLNWSGNLYQLCWSEISWWIDQHSHWVTRLYRRFASSWYSDLQLNNISCSWDCRLFLLLYNLLLQCSKPYFNKIAVTYSNHCNELYYYTRYNIFSFTAVNWTAAMAVSYDTELYLTAPVALSTTTDQKAVL